MASIRYLRVEPSKDLAYFPSVLAVYELGEEDQNDVREKECRSVEND